MEIKLVAASQDDHPIIQNLARFYVYDLSEYAGWPCPEDGHYECRDLSVYWRTPGVQFLLKVDGELAGFALVDRNPSPEHDYWMGEFFVLRKFRRQGVGSSAARLILDRFRGSWMIGQLPNNRPAIAFWRTFIAGYAGNQFLETVRYVDHVDEEMNVFEFRSLARI